MSTNKTQHYQLNQWEPTDAVLRVDFNADNQKLDSVLRGLAENKADKTALDTAVGAEAQARVADVGQLRAENVWVKVGEMTANAATDTIALTVPNAEQYRELVMHYTLSGPGTAWLLWNGSTPIVAFTDSNQMSLVVGRMELTAAHSGGALLIYDVHTKDNSGVSRGNNGNSFLSGCTFSGAVSIGLRAGNGSFSAGTYMDVYGLKK